MSTEDAKKKLDELFATIDKESPLADLSTMGGHAYRAGYDDLAVRELIAETLPLVKPKRNKDDVETAIRTGYGKARDEKASTAEKEKQDALAKRKKVRDQNGGFDEDGGWLPPNFRLAGDGEHKKADGLICRVETISEEIEHLNPVCRYFSPVMRGFDTDDGNECIIVLTGTASRPLRIPLADMAGNSAPILRSLSKAGLTIVPGEEKPFGWLLAATFDLDLPRLETATTPGWKQADDDGPLAFVLPDGQNVIKGVKFEDRTGKRPTTPKVYLNNPRKEQIGGTWQGYASSLKACWESSVAQFQMVPLIAMTGVLSSLIGLPTPIWSLTGESSSGKSTCLKLIAAAVGHPGGKKGAYRTMKATSNAPEGQLPKANGTALCWDETALFEGDLHDLLFMISSESGKDRMNADMTEREAAEWKTAVFLASEHSIDELLQQVAKKKGRTSGVGTVARCADIAVEEKWIEPERMGRIEATLPTPGNAGHFGHLLPRFVERLFNDGDTTAAGIAALEKRIEAKARELAGDTPIKLRVARFFATAWECGDILIRPGFDALPSYVKAEEIETFIKKQWNRFVEGDTARNLDAAATAADAIRSYLLKHYRRHGQNVRDKETTPAGELRFYYDDLGETGAEFWIPKADFKAILGEAARTAVTVSKVAKHLDANGILIRQKDDELLTDYIPGHGYERCYRLWFKGMDVSDADAGQTAADEKQAAADRAAAVARAEEAKAAEERRRAEEAQRKEAAKAERVETQHASGVASGPDTGRTVIHAEQKFTTERPKRKRNF